MKIRKCIKCVLTLALTVLLFIGGAVNTSATINDKKISLMGIIDKDNADRTSWIDPAAMYLSGMEKTSISKFKDFDVGDMVNQLYKQDMLVVHTHGNQKSIIANKNSERSSITTTLLDTVFAKTSLKQMRICFIGACECGKGGKNADNFVNKLYSKGPICVIGYTQSVYTKCNRTMLQRFCNYVSWGNNVKDALLKAQQDVYDQYGTYGYVNCRLVRGNDSVAMTDSSYKMIGTIALDDVPVYSCSEEEFFSQFELSGYVMEVQNMDDSVMKCMRAYINDIKTNDIIYCLKDLQGNIISKGSPRVGNAEKVKIDNVTKQDITKYVNGNYNIYDINDIIVDVIDADNALVNVYYCVGDSIETLNISLNDVCGK